MPVTTADIPQFVGLAERLRRETNGCTPWDRHGAAAVFARDLVGMNFRIALELVIAHACDPAAKTPGSIKRPFKPERAPEQHRNPHRDEACPDCGGWRGACPCKTGPKPLDDDEPAVQHEPWMPKDPQLAARLQERIQGASR